MFILVLFTSYLFMEFVAWFAHKYVMRGFGWFLHADHHSLNHLHHTRDHGECFGLLVFPIKYLKMEPKKS